MSETVSLQPPELGDLVENLPDGRLPYLAPELLDWARTNFPKPEIDVKELNSERMLGEVSITLDGQPARIGWFKIDGNMKTLNPYRIERNERLTILEGSVALKQNETFISLSAPSEKDPTPFNQTVDFNAGTEAYLRDPSGPVEGRCWYLFTPLDRA